MKANDILLACNLYSNMYYFLQVIKATAKTVTIRRIYSNQTEGTPRPNDFMEWELERTKRITDGKVHLSNWTVAELWDGTPVHNEHAVWGLNYNLY